jgi:hypothetical protein
VVGETLEFGFMLGGIEIFAEHFSDVFFLNNPAGEGLLLFLLLDLDVGGVDLLLFQFVSWPFFGVFCSALFLLIAK